jgi:hypothetical protein
MAKMIVQCGLLALVLLPGLARADSAAIDELLAKTAALHAEALAMEHGWSVTEPLMEEARAAQADGDLERAEALAQRALLTAEQAVLQAKREADAWRERALGG